MATALLKKNNPSYGPRSSGIFMSPWEFDRAQFLRGYRYELINGVLIVSLSPLENERDPNGELEYLLRRYQKEHPQGKILDRTLAEQTIRTGENRRIADRAIWVGLGRLPRRRDVPAVAVEFVSRGKRNAERDYEIKRDEYQACGVLEYWVFDRFMETLTVYQFGGRRPRKKVVTADQVYSSPLLPGFVVPVGDLLKLANQWPEKDEDEE